MKVLIQSNDIPFCLAHGGVAVQVAQTMAALQRLGIDVDYLRWWDETQQADLIHCFGRAHPVHVRFARGKGIRYVQSELLTGQGSRSAGRLRAGAIRNRLLRALARRRGWPQGPWSSYELVDVSIALTEWEAQLMRDLYLAPPATVRVVPNGVESLFLDQPAAATARENHLICCATITERKQVVELARAASRVGVRVLFVGEPYHQDDPYYREFVRLQREDPEHIIYEGGIHERGRMAAVYRRARGFVLLSTMESQSLAALEAAACGCPLLLSDLPWARCSFGTMACYVPADKPATWGSLLAEFHQQAPTLPRANSIMISWDEVARQLMVVYQDVLRRGPVKIQE